MGIWLKLLTLVALLQRPDLAAAAERFFTTTDGVRLHFTETGPGNAPTLVFVPGWTMPAWIFQQQIKFFSHDYHVVAFDPRGQGDSDSPPTGYEPFRRGADIGDLIHALGGKRVVLIGWSLGVLDSLAYVHTAGDGDLLGMVLVDNSVGEDPPPRATRAQHREGRPSSRAQKTASFVRGMFVRRQDADYLAALTEAALRTPASAAAALLAYPVPRNFWREAIYAVHKPILYVVTPRFAGQADNLLARHPGVQTEIYADAGHALFVDDADRFDADMLAFLRTQVHGP